MRRAVNNVGYARLIQKESKEIKMMKKGEITTSTMVSLILIVVGLVIVLIFISQLAWKGRVDREACHASVISRATVEGSILQSYVPLTCKTNKVCFTSGIIGGDCEKDFNNAKGITKVKVDNTEQIEKEISQEILDCWTMMGEGKVGVFNQYLAKEYSLGTVYPSCVICSRIAFDKDNLKISDEDMKNIDIRKYMITHKVPDQDISYWNYLGGDSAPISISDTLNIPAIPEEKATDTTPGTRGAVGEKDIKKDSLGFTSNLTEELAVVFMQISPPKSWGETLTNDMQAVLGFGAASSSLIGVPSTVKLATAGGWWTVAAAAIFGVYQYGSVSYNMAVSASYCDDVTVGKDSMRGCSVVRTMNYDAENLKQYCSVIESIA